jgi:hypothetical protein
MKTGFVFWYSSFILKAGYRRIKKPINPSTNEILYRIGKAFFHFIKYNGAYEQ